MKGKPQFLLMSYFEVVLFLYVCGRAADNVILNMYAKPDYSVLIDFSKERL